ncbi:MAG: hemerythrin domain-containing protein [Proteobacteria bacterium]|nr:hemerythrin domain-containing protein [Pseudomonadota bacterium]HQR04091.1 hemerythrin domain-containing protein [Rhodocyclaceae bacterium]
MKRRPRLQGLAREHHGALVLARQLMTAEMVAWPEWSGRIATIFATDFEPHFCAEEHDLLPLLAATDAAALALRTRAEHDRLRDLATAAASDPGMLAEFGRLLRDHVRFEDRELFPAAEQVLPDAWLDTVVSG